MSNNDEKSRENLKIVGYEHPTDTNSFTNTYKVYSEDSKDVYVSQTQDTYAKFDNNSSSRINICTKCEHKALYVCPCPIGEMMCKNNHMWYTTKQGIIVFEDPHQSYEIHE
jgi:hypothetical protein